MGLLLVIIILIVGSIADSIETSKRRSSAAKKGYSCYWSKGGLRDVKTGQYINLYEDYEKFQSKLRIEKFLKHEDEYTSYEEYLKKNGFPNLWRDIMIKDLKHWHEVVDNKTEE